MSKKQIQSPEASPEIKRQLKAAQSQLALYAKDLNRTLEELRQSEEKFRGIVSSAQDAIILIDDQNLVCFWNDAAEHIFGYTQAEAEGQNLGELIIPERLRKTHAKGLKKFIKTGKGPVIGLVNELPAMRKDGSEFICENSISAVWLDGKWNAIGIVRDITERKQAEQERVEYTARLKDSMIHTVQAMSHTIEERDPYTAGHQRRVAELAMALGKALQLQEDCIEGLYFSGLIHNIGYIHIPGEIISRPGKLHAAEFEIIKSHCQVGSEIIRDADLPWPVADTILQHHERLDGSGYPNGLQGEAIMLEARILAVADVVAAITSHRPYRSAQTIDAAMAEISEHRGSLYDPDVVDACVGLFKDEKFSFEQAGA